MLILLNGNARSGKDTFAKIAAIHGWERLALADKLRQITYKLYPILQIMVSIGGEDYAKENFPYYRETLQATADRFKETFGLDFWAKQAANSIRLGKKFVVTDLRYDYELPAFQNHPGSGSITVVRIERPGYEPANSHSSEKGVSRKYINHVMANDGPYHEYEAKVHKFVEEFEKPSVQVTSTPSTRAS